MRLTRAMKATIAAMAVLAAPVSVSAQCLVDNDCTIYVKHAVFDGWVDGPTFYGGDFFGDTAGFDFMYANSKSFRIDHPLDPANKYLLHWSVESPEMKNIYDGVVTLDANGAAWVSLPSWFDSLNRSFRYQLTSIGGPGAGLYIAEEVSDRRFRIAGGTPNLKVSWQVTGIRHDPSALRNPDTVEQEKAQADKGRYVDPAAYGKPMALRIRSARAHAASQGKPDSSGAAHITPQSFGPMGGLALAFVFGTLALSRSRKQSN